MQLLSLLFLGFTGCTTTPPPEQQYLPEGLYHFDAPIFYKKGWAQLSHTPRGVRVQLLETFKGAFTLKTQADGRVYLIDDDISYPGLKRTLKGEGRITSIGEAAGTATVWLKTMGPVSRNHRKGPWRLVRATAEDIRKFESKQQTLETRKERAREGSLIP